MKKEIKLGLIQAIGVTIYCGLVGSVMQNGSKLFGQKDNFMTPVFVLIMLSVSVLICGLLVIKKPYELFFDGKKKEAINVVVYTAVFLFFILLFLFGAMMFMK